jgi:PRTRC genetic system ThiF family protein
MDAVYWARGITTAMPTNANAYRLPSSWMDRALHVSLIGCGGSGSEVLDGLARIDRALRALGHPGLDVTAYDPDTVSETNTIRQRFWPADVGQNKAELLMHRYGTFGGLCGRAVAAAFDAADLLEGGLPDLLVTCVDRASLRASVARITADPDWRDTNALWLDLGNGARTGQVILGHLNGWRNGDGLPHVAELFPELLTHAEALDADDTPSCSADEALAAQDLFINRWCAVTACDLLWRLLRYGRIEAHGALIAAEGSRVRELPIDPQVWASFGLSVADRAETA